MHPLVRASSVELPHEVYLAPDVMLWKRAMSSPVMTLLPWLGICAGAVSSAAGLDIGEEEGEAVFAVFGPGMNIQITSTQRSDVARHMTKSRRSLRVLDALTRPSRGGARWPFPSAAPPCPAGSSENARKGWVSTSDFMIWVESSHSLSLLLETSLNQGTDRSIWRPPAFIPINSCPRCVAAHTWQPFHDGLRCPSKPFRNHPNLVVVSRSLCAHNPGVDRWVVTCMMHNELIEWREDAATACAELGHLMILIPTH